MADSAARDRGPSARAIGSGKNPLVPLLQNPPKIISDFLASNHHSAGEFCLRAIIGPPYCRISGS